MEMIADRIARHPRRRRWQDADADGDPARRTLGIGNLGGATLDNEENYLIKKLMTAPRRRPGREPGPHMTQLHGPRSGDLVRTRRRHRPSSRTCQNSDCILIMGSNMAENHPVGLPVGDGGAERGAQVIHVDPRFTRTSAMATDCTSASAPARDIAFLGGLVNYILEHDRWFREYVAHYTNAPVIIDEDFARHRGPRRALLRLGPRARRRTTRDVAVRGHGRARRRRASGEEPTKGEQSATAATAAGLQHGEPPAARTRRSSTRAASSSS